MEVVQDTRTIRDCVVMNDQFRSSGDEGEKMAAEASKQRLGVCN